MTVTLDLNPETEKALKARAGERGLSLEEYVREVVMREAATTVAANLSDFLLNSPFVGANLDLERSKDYPRPVEIG